MEAQNTKILLVDDESDILEFVSYNLRKEGFIVHTANNGVEAINKALEIKPELILLDVMMPEMDGIETCEKIRENPLIDNTTIAFLTARGEDYSQIAGLNAGGDDYIAKPIKPKLLVSRINALLRRGSRLTNNGTEQNPHVSTYGELVIDKERYLVIKSGEELQLPKKEFNLLSLLASKPSKVFTRDEIFDKIWGADIFVGDRTIDVYIRKLREKIGENHIKTMKGVGYKFEFQ